MYQQNENQNLDTTDTKIYVGGLPWETRNEGLRSFFEEFGEIIHVNVVIDRATGRSKGYGFVTFKDAESATRACVNPNPTIGRRIANCKLASSGDNVNQNQTNQIDFPLDDLCYLSPSFWQNQHQPSSLPQPLHNYVGPYWHYPQHLLQYDPQNYLQYYPQFYQQYWPYQ